MSDEDDEALRKFILDYLRENMTVDVQLYEDGNFAVRIKLDGYLIDSDYSNHRKELFNHD